MAVEELSRPLAVIDRLFEQNIAQLGAGSAPPADFGEKAHFSKALGFDNEENLAKIPCLNDVELVEQIPPFTLVRYRCLVQDVFEPEIYESVLQETGGSAPARFVSSKYRERVEPVDGRQLQSLEGHQSLAQRGASYCVPLPGERTWARCAAAEWTRNGGGNIAPQQVPTTSSAPKRRRDDDVSMEPVDDMAQKPRVETPPVASTGSTPAMAKNPCCAGYMGGQSGAGIKTAEDFGLNFPLPSEEGRGRGKTPPCIVKLYDADAEALKLCQSIEVIGVLCVNPEIAQIADRDTGSMEDEWRDARHPSTSLVPRLHALAFRNLPFQSPLLPFTPDFLTEERLAAAFQRQFAAGAIVAARAAALDQLAKCVGGDAVTAEYLLMLLVSRSFSTHGEKLLGSWSLNVSGWQASSGVDSKALVDAAGELVPRAALLEITSNTLETQNWKPRKDFVADRLVASQLQLAAGTLVVFDESKLTEGQLTAHGVKAYHAIQTLVSDNKLACDFQSYDVKIPLELACIFLSERKSFIKEIDVVVPLRAAAAVNTAVTSEALIAARWLVSLVTRSPRPLKIPDPVMNSFSNDFALVRQGFKVKPELAHTWLALARARCLTFGEDEMSPQRWQEVFELEKTRLCRCREDNLIEA